jgi:hypothetical protein
MIIRVNSSIQAAFISKSLFSCDQIDGIELNGGEDDFGDEILRRLPGRSVEA